MQLNKRGKVHIGCSVCSMNGKIAANADGHFEIWCRKPCVYSAGQGAASKRLLQLLLTSSAHHLQAITKDSASWISAAAAAACGMLKVAYPCSSDADAIIWFWCRWCWEPVTEIPFSSVWKHCCFCTLFLLYCTVNQRLRASAVQPGIGNWHAIGCCRLGGIGRKGCSLSATLYKPSLSLLHHLMGKSPGRAKHMCACQKQGGPDSVCRRSFLSVAIKMLLLCLQEPWIANAEE